MTLKKCWMLSLPPPPAPNWAQELGALGRRSAMGEGRVSKKEGAGQGQVTPCERTPREPHAHVLFIQLVMVPQIGPSLHPPRLGCPHPALGTAWGRSFSAWGRSSASTHWMPVAMLPPPPFLTTKHVSRCPCGGRQSCPGWAPRSSAHAPPSLSRSLLSGLPAATSQCCPWAPDTCS